MSLWELILLTARYCLFFAVMFFLLSCARERPETLAPISETLAPASKTFAPVSEEKIRVAVLKGVKSVNIGGVAGGEINGNYLYIQSSREKPLSVSLDESGGLSVRERRIAYSAEGGANPSVSFFPRNETLYVNGRPFREKIEVMKEQAGLVVINELPLELYVAGLINYEISSKWNMEAVKAQAVIARTYALYQKKRAFKPYHLEGTVMSQVYSGSITEDERSLQAARETRGEVLQYAGEPALTVYHSNAGGMTEGSENVWGKGYIYLRSVRSPYDEDSPNYYWVLILTQQSIETALKSAGHRVGEIKEIIPLQKTESGRITRLRILSSNGSIDMSGEDLRRIIGYEKLKSTMFTVESSGSSFVLKGKGSGHGVGLSQWGAKGLAEKGYSYIDILRHFYPGTTLNRIYQ